MKVLVTAGGSELACSVLKACRRSDMRFHIVVSDMNPWIPGRKWCDDFVTLPSAKKRDDYMNALEDLVRNKGISAVIPTSDMELSLLSREKKGLSRATGCSILVNDAGEYERFTNKRRAGKWFAENAIPTPKTLLPRNVEACDPHALPGFPLLVKPAYGGGSKDIHKAESIQELKQYLAMVPDPIIQEFILQTDAEFTAGTYRQRDNTVHVILLKRRLKFGMTNYAETITDRPDLEAFCRTVIQKTRLIGANNIQFILTDSGPKVLEINPRFSGTAGIRAMCGFNDVEMWLTEALKLGAVKKPHVKKKRIARYMAEYEI